jgi:hypothetical protein
VATRNQAKKPKTKTTLEQWEKDLQSTHLPKILDRLAKILIEFQPGDYNGTLTDTIDSDVSDMETELTDPSNEQATHAATMLNEMQLIADLESNISVYGTQQDFPQPPPPTYSYVMAMNYWFARIDDMTWNIYNLLHPTKPGSPTAPNSTDPGDQIGEYAEDIWSCISKIDPKLMARHYASKSPGTPLRRRKK